MTQYNGEICFKFQSKFSLTYEDPISNLKLCKGCEENLHLSSITTEEDLLDNFEDNLDSPPCLRNYHQSVLHTNFLKRVTSEIGDFIKRFDESNFTHVIRLKELNHEMYNVMMKISTQLYNIERIAEIISKTKTF
jgi:hypothetical protein